MWACCAAPPPEVGPLALLDLAIFRETGRALPRAFCHFLLPTSQLPSSGRLAAHCLQPSATFSLPRASSLTAIFRDTGRALPLAFCHFLPPTSQLLSSGRLAVHCPQPSATSYLPRASSLTAIFIETGRARPLAFCHFLPPTRQLPDRHLHGDWPCTASSLLPLPPSHEPALLPPSSGRLAVHCL
jgi:hypothetical protein